MKEGENDEAESTQRRPTQRRPALLNSEVKVDNDEAESTQRRPTLLNSEFKVENAESESTQRRQALLNSEVKVENAEAESTQRWPTLLLEPEVIEPEEEDTYQKVPLAFPVPEMYKALQRYLPADVRANSEIQKATYMDDIIMRYAPSEEEMQMREYRENIASNYQPLHKVLYTMHATDFFVPSFSKAISENTEESFRNIMSEPSPAVITFEMLQPQFCHMLMAEVRHFQAWIHESDLVIKRQKTINNLTCLDDFGMEAMLQEFMEGFILPISKVFFTEVGGSTLDDHHAYVAEYDRDTDIELGFQVDDAEVTLNVCLGKEFSGGELCFQGVRCEKHVDTEAQPEEILEYSHVQGHAILHYGRNRHTARETTSGKRINLLIWCQSSSFRELRKYETVPSWCAQCNRDKDEFRKQKILKFKSVLLL